MPAPPVAGPPPGLPPDCLALFAREGLPPPGVLAEAGLPLSAHGPFVFASPNWPAEAPFEELPARWLAQPERSWGMAGLFGHGLQSAALCVALATPAAGLFMQRRWSQAFGQGPTLALRIEGALKLMSQLHAAVRGLEASRRWPAGRRLLLVDDDFTAAAWGWLAPGEAPEAALRPDDMAYIRALMALEALKTDTPVA